MVVTLLINALLVRLLSPAEVGLYFLIFSTVSVAKMVAQLGLPQTAVRLIASAMAERAGERARSVIYSSFFYATLGGVAVALALPFAARDQALAKLIHIPPQLAVVMPLVSCWIVILTWQELQSAVLRGFHDLRSSTLFGGTGSDALASLLLAALLLFAQHERILPVVGCFVLADAASVAAGGLFLSSRCGGLARGTLIPWRELLGVSLPVFVVVVVNSVVAQSSLWIVAGFCREEEVALFGAASRLAGTLSFFLMIANTVLSPMIAEFAAQQRKQELEKLLRDAALLVFLPALLPFLLFLLFGAELLGGLFGDFYRGGSGLLALLASGTIFNVWTGACGTALMMTGHQATVMKITVCSSIVTVSFSLLLASRHGAAGVALATSAGLVLQNVLLLLFSRRKTGIWTHARFALPDFKLFSKGSLS